MKIKESKFKIILAVLILTGAILRFYNLNWGAPFYFHPDERNIASAVSQLNFPDQMNPHFFAYGSLPIYTIYFTGMVVNSTQYPMSNIQATISNVKFEEAIIISRVYSAIFSILLIPLLFFIGKKLKDNKAGLLAAFLATMSVGFIQFAHFGTFEMWLTLFGVLLFWLCLKKVTENTIFLMGLVLGVLVSTKVSSLVLFPLPIIAITLSLFVIPAKAGIQEERYRSRIKFGMTILKHFILLLIVASSVYIISNPYVFYDTTAFQSSMKYESTLALGILPVFYTGEFYSTVPGVFQFLYVYPFLLNPVITFLFIPAFFYILYKGFKERKSSYILLTTFYIILFCSQAFLFVKWTRYMVPTLPFMYLIVAIALSEVIARNEAISFIRRLPRLDRELSRIGSLPLLAMTILIVTCTVFGLSYFATAFTKPDTRIVAKQFAQTTIPADSQILSEVYDLGVIPFNEAFKKIDLFNFYDLDSSNPFIKDELQKKLNNSEYIILPSQRLLKIRLNNPGKFPNGYSFYNDLITGKLRYEKLYETHCDIFCKITYLGDPVFRYEETVNVFERPTVFIFRKK